MAIKHAFTVGSTALAAHSKYRISLLLNDQSHPLRYFCLKTFGNRSRWTNVSTCIRSMSSSLTNQSKLLGFKSYPKILFNQAATFASDEKKGFSLNPLTWWKDRQEKKEEEKYKKKIADMAATEVWTISNMLAEVEEATKSWAAKIVNSSTISSIKKMEGTLKGIIYVVGRDATCDQLESLNRVEKLKCAVAGESTVEEVNLIIQQFQSVHVLHRVLRKRVAEGKSIPQTSEAISALIQIEGPKMMSKDQKKRMSERHSTRLRRGR